MQFAIGVSVCPAHDAVCHRCISLSRSRCSLPVCHRCISLSRSRCSLPSVYQFVPLTMQFAIGVSVCPAHDAVCHRCISLSRSRCSLPSVYQFVPLTMQFAIGVSVCPAHDAVCHRCISLSRSRCSLPSVYQFVPLTMQFAIGVSVCPAHDAVCHRCISLSRSRCSLPSVYRPNESLHRRRQHFIAVLLLSFKWCLIHIKHCLLLFYRAPCPRRWLPPPTSPPAIGRLPRPSSASELSLASVKWTLILSYSAYFAVH